MKRLSDLSAAQAKLVRECQRLNFGRIEQLAIHDGEPVVDPPPKVVQEIKFGGHNGARSEAEMEDFVLREEVREMVDFLAERKSGMINVLHVKHGLPFSMHFSECDRPAGM